MNLNKSGSSNITREEIFAIANEAGNEIELYENLISFPIKSASVDNDFEGGLVDSKTLQLVNEGVLLRRGKISQNEPGFDRDSFTIAGLPVAEEILFLWWHFA